MPDRALSHSVTWFSSSGKNKKLKLQALALQQEMKILSSLEHPNIIKYLGTEYSHHIMRIFLELANEGSLKDALTEFGKKLLFMKNVYLPLTEPHYIKTSWKNTKIGKE